MRYEGLIFAKILPPKQLYFPLLPYNHQGKLVFVLCRTCLIEQRNGNCHHTDNERCLVDTWCTPEVHKALEYGYKVLDIYEVWHFAKTSQFDKELKVDGIFNRYVDTFYKVKTE